MLCIAGWFAVAPAGLGDWPMWRHDAARSGATPEGLPDRLSVVWTRQLPAYEPAWPEEPRLGFDAAYEPVIAGGRVFVGMPVDGSVRAYDLTTGEEVWRAYTGGPVRFAPAVAEGRVYVVSDDGFLYAFAAGTGKLLWRVRGVDVPERLHLGNGRLIDMRPARGGPVVAGGVVYFAAGIWPTMGVAVHAVEARSGKRLWSNTDCYWIPDVRIDHNNVIDAALSPQGYLLIAGGKLLVPNGRSMPAGLDLKTGRLLYYVQGYRRGDCRVTASTAPSAKFAFVGTGAVINLADGREVGSKWKAAGKNAPQRFDASRFDLFEGPFFGYKFMPGCDAWSVHTSDRVYGMHRGVVYAYDSTRPTTREYVKKHGGHELHPLRWDLPLLWKLAIPGASRAGRGILLLAGKRLYGAAGSVVFAIDLPSQAGGPGADTTPQPRVAWTIEVEGTPLSMAASGGKLLLSTRERMLICLGSGSRGGAVRRHVLSSGNIRQPDEGIRERVRRLLALARRRDGYAVVAGGADAADFARALVLESKMRVVLTGVSGQTRTALVREFAEAGLYGRRFEVVPAGMDRLPDYIADVVVVPDAAARGEANAPVATLRRILHPYGGTAFLPEAWAASVENAFKESDPDGLRLDARGGGGWCVVRRDGMLPGADQWTHECADAARTYYSHDRRVRPPLGILWYGDGSGYGFWKMHDYGSGVKPQVAGGRLFALRQRSPSTLTALDVYTGRRLWEREVGRFCRYAVSEDAVYLIDGTAFVVLDAATGKRVRKVSVDVSEYIRGAAIGRDIRVDGGVAVVSLGPGPIAGGSYLLMQIGGLWDGTVLAALDVETGKKLWDRPARNRFCNNALAMGDGLVFCTDSFSPVEGAKLVERGVQISAVTSVVRALDARTGAVRWEFSMTNPYRNFPPGNWLGMRALDDWVGYSHKHRLLLAGRSGNMVALDARTGKKRWERKGGAAQPVVIREDTCISQSGAILSLADGSVRGSVTMRRMGCNYAIAGAHLLLLRDAFVSYADLDSPTLDRYWLRNIRSGCSASLIPADGVVSAPCFSVGCVCNYPIQTSFAMVTMPEVRRWAHPVSRPKASAGKAPRKSGGADAPPAAGAVLVPRDAVWKYWDRGVVAGKWKDPDFDDRAWPEGKAELGYGDGDEATRVQFGGDSRRKFITTWFRHTFTVSDPARFRQLHMALKRDDGAVVYLNGREVFRSNMPPGTIAADTRAAGVTAGRAEKQWFTATVPATFLRKGRNVLAVEVHQAYPESSDISFALELRAE